MMPNISYEKYSTIFIIISLALITIILLLQTLDINFSFSFGVKSALEKINQSLNDINNSVNNLQTNLNQLGISMTPPPPPGIYFNSDVAEVSDVNVSDFPEECNLEGLTDEEIESLTDEELQVLCPGF